MAHSWFTGSRSFAPSLLVAMLCGPLAGTVQAATLVEDQDFTGASGTTHGDWAIQGNGADFITTTQADGSNGTVVQLTPALDTRSGTLVYDQAFSSSLGVQVVFDYYMADGSGADGLAFFLVDGTEDDVTPGKSGGTLGYGTDYNVIPGVPNAYFAVGFDLFGNGRNEFGDAAGTSPNGGGALVNNFALVGSGNGTSGYRYLGGATDANLGGGWRKADILVRRGDGGNGCADGGTCVTVKFSTDNGNNWTTVHDAVRIDTLGGQVAIPATFKLGFSGSTGGLTNNHYIDNAQIFFDVDGFQVSVSRAGTGSGTVTSTSLPSQATQLNCGAVCDVAYPVNTDVTLVATADAGSVFTGWAGDCSGTDTDVVITVDAAKACTATFTPSHTVSTSAGANGSIAPGNAVVAEGDTTAFTLTPDTGYSIESADGCGGTLTGNTYTTGAIAGDCIVTVSFSLNSYSVSTSVGSGGSVSPAGAVVNHGATADFTFTPDTGYRLGTVSGCGGTLAGTTYTTGAITGACTVTASFVRTGDAVVTSGNGGGGAFGWAPLTGLLLFAARRRVRATLCVLPVLLAAAGTTGAADGGWYVGAQFGRADTDVDSADVSADMAARAIAGTAEVSDTTRNAWRVFGGYDVTPWLAVEGGYTDLGEIVTRLRNTGLLGGVELRDVVPVSGEGVEAAAVARYAVSDRYRGFVRAGLWRWKSEFELIDVDGSTHTFSQRGTDLVAGLGAEAQLAEHWSARLGWDHYRMERDPSNVYYLAVIFRR